MGSWGAPVPLQLNSLLITPETGWWNTTWGGGGNTPTSFGNV